MHDGTCALFLAAQTNNIEIVNMLLEAGADKDQKRDDDTTSLIIAAEKGHVEVVKVRFCPTTFFPSFGIRTAISITHRSKTASVARRLSWEITRLPCSCHWARVTWRQRTNTDRTNTHNPSGDPDRPTQTAPKYLPTYFRFSVVVEKKSCDRCPRKAWGCLAAGCFEWPQARREAPH
jgi:hypothetical protein